MAALSINDGELRALKAVVEALIPLGESERRWVLKTALDRLTGTVPDTSDTSRPIDGGQRRVEKNESAPDAQPKSTQTVKDFLRKKLPSTDLLRVACLGYFLATELGQTEFKTIDVRRLNHRSGSRNFSNLTVTMNNATRQSGFFAPVGKGFRRITTRCEELVEALPDGEAVKSVMARMRKGRRRPPKTQSSAA